MSLLQVSRKDLEKSRYRVGMLTFSQKFLVQVQVITEKPRSVICHRWKQFLNKVSIKVSGSLTEVVRTVSSNVGNNTGLGGTATVKLSTKNVATINFKLLFGTSLLLS